MDQRVAPAPTQAGWKMSEFCPLVRLSKAKIHQLSADMQPRSVRIGRSRIIVESPAEWLARMASVQAAA
ncbi:MAG: hypothetical protein ABI624_10050 [Casimicrobiaceae bacterium]